jgi:hypothetical protein
MIEILAVCSMMIVDPHCVRSVQPIVPFPLNRSIVRSFAGPEVPLTGTTSTVITTQHGTTSTTVASEQHGAKR